MGTTILGKQMSELGNVVDPTIAAIASAATINPTDIIHRITGNVTIGTITQPNPYFNGPIIFYNTDAAVGVWDTSGNIALGGTFTRFKNFSFIFDPVTSKWYPSAIS